MPVHRQSCVARGACLPAAARTSGASAPGGVLLRFAALATLVMLAPAGVALGDQPWPLIGKPILTFETPPDDALFMPTAVTIAPDGSVYVVDGVNDRVVHFDAQGRPLERISAVGTAQLSSPVGARVDAQGRLWIADTGNHRVLVRNPDGALEREIVVPAAVLKEPPDLTDLAISPDGKTVFLVDNDHHRIISYDLADSRVSTFGTLGESLGEFHYPFTIALAPDGELLVTDVINGRIQRLTRDGVPTGTVGGYGVDYGQLYRPKSTALDAEQVVWISDGTLDVIQAFRSDGRLVDVLRTEDGEPLRLDSPMGLAFDPDGYLYAVELGAGRVRKFEILRDASAPPPVVVTRRGTSTIGPQARGCTICHFEWVRPLVNGQSTPLADVPPNPPEHPWVSRAEQCLSCHDGSVGDARRRVWVEHGHRVGIEPPDSITIPADMPLANGKLACRTCHSAHSSSEERTTIEGIVFLRTDESPAELCSKCHTSFTGDVSAGMHPLVKMPFELPADLVHIDSPETRSQITCLGCHTGHGGVHDDLLVLNPNSNDLCLACHQKLTPDLFGPDVVGRHGHAVRLTAEQVAVAGELGTRRGPGDELLCTTCHVSHNAPTEHNLLAFDLAQRDACAECHVEQNGVIDSPHDMRTSEPGAVEVAGARVESSGACAGCHTAHHAGIEPNPTIDDPRGLCMNCHAAGRMAGDSTLGPHNHPESVCTDCHDPHATGFGNFLTARPSERCIECHADYAGVVSGPHDVSNRAPAWPASSVQAGDTCLACHRPHGDAAQGMFRAGLAEDKSGVDAACLACHAAATPGHASGIALLHPREVRALHSTRELPFATGNDGKPRVACNTCHDPHRADADTSLLRVRDDQTLEDMCLTCHAERVNVHMIGHAEDSMRRAGFAVGGCQPCHLTHGEHDQVEPHIMWPKALSQFEGAENTPIADHYCVSCHRTGGPVAPPAIASHPEVEMFNPEQPDSPGFLPLFNENGEVDPAGHISCRTCHLTHGRSEPAPLAQSLADTADRERRARAWHVRTLGPANVCTTCHGFDALRRFMYFHDATRRGGPIESR